jgi:hypothetical protein
LRRLFLGRGRRSHPRDDRARDATLEAITKAFITAVIFWPLQPPDAPGLALEFRRGVL